MINAYAINPNIAAKYEHRLALIMQRHVRNEGHFGKLPNNLDSSVGTRDSGLHRHGRKYRVLEMLKAKGPMTARQIADAMDVDRQKASDDLCDLNRKNMPSLITTSRSLFAICWRRA